MIRVTIDLNVRLAHNLTFAGYEDIHGEVPEVGECVWAWEEESNLYARAIVVDKTKPELGLIYLAVAWTEFHEPFVLSAVA